MSASRRFGKGAPSPIDRASLEHGALRYLDRFDATASRLATVLRRAVDRSIAPSEQDLRNEAYVWCEQVVARCIGAGLVDDARYARGSAQGMRRRGASAKAVIHRLMARGVPHDTALAALDALADEVREDPELEAARALVRRRRFGHFRPEPERRECRNKDLAALARAGFSLDVARRALDLPLDDG